MTQHDYVGWWVEVLREAPNSVWEIVVSEPASRVLHRLTRTDDPEGLTALQALFRELPMGIPKDASKVGAVIPIYRVMAGRYRVTLAIKDERLWIDRITPVAVHSP